MLSQDSHALILLGVKLQMERVKGVEPSSLAWEARVMPLYDTRRLADSSTF